MVFNPKVVKRPTDGSWEGLIVHHGHRDDMISAKATRQHESWNCFVLDPRKLAAIDLAFLGPKVIIVEFATGVALSTALGLFVLIRGGGAPTQIALGLYLISLGVNYMPMLIYAIAIKNAKSAIVELGSELENKGEAMARYRRQSLWLLVPLIVPLAALRQIRRARVNKN